MDVEDFVARTLSQIASGLESANSSTGTFRLNNSDGVGFDLAVSYEETATKSKDAKGGFNVKVLKAESGGESGRSAKSTAISRVTFKVYHQSERNRSGVVSARPPAAGIDFSV